MTERARSLDPSPEIAINELVRTFREERGPEVRRTREGDCEDLYRDGFDQRRFHRKALGHRGRGLRRHRDLRERLSRLRRLAPGRRAHGAGCRPHHHLVPAVPRFRRPARAAALARVRPRGTQVRRDAGAGHRPDADLLQRLADRARRHRPRRGRLPRARRARGQTGAAGRLRGAGVGQAHPRSSRRLGDRAAGRSSECRADPRFVPHARPQDRRRLDPGDPARQDLHRPARRRAADRHGLSLLEPPFPLHAGAGRPSGQGFHERGGGDRL